MIDEIARGWVFYSGWIQLDESQTALTMGQAVELASAILGKK